MSLDDRDDVVASFAEAAQAAYAAGAQDWPTLCAAMIRALQQAENPADLVAAAHDAAAPTRLELIQMRDAILIEISRSERYRGKGMRARAEAIGKDLSDFYRNRFSADEAAPQHDPDRGFHRIISNRSALIGASRRAIGWNSIYQIITKD